MNRDRLNLNHIVECLEWIDHYLSEGKEIFFTDRKTQSAVLRELQTLAESTQKLSVILKTSNPEVDWEEIAGFRNVLVHDYLGINLDRVWQIIEDDLPSFRDAIRKIHKEINDQ